MRQGSCFLKDYILLWYICYRFLDLIWKGKILEDIYWCNTHRNTMCKSNTFYDFLIRKQSYMNSVIFFFCNYLLPFLYCWFYWCFKFLAHKFEWIRDMYLKTQKRETILSFYRHFCLTLFSLSKRCYFSTLFSKMKGINTIS